MVNRAHNDPDIEFKHRIKNSIINNFQYSNKNMKKFYSKLSMF